MSQLQNKKINKIGVRFLYPRHIQAEGSPKNIAIKFETHSSNKILINSKTGLLADSTSYLGFSNIIVLTIMNYVGI